MCKQVAALNLCAVAFRLSAIALLDRSILAEELLGDPISYIGHGAMMAPRSVASTKIAGLFEVQ